MHYRFLLIFMISIYWFAMPETADAKRVQLQIGETAPTWTKMKGTDDKLHDLSDFKKSKLVVLVFMGTECPIAQHYEPKLTSLARELKSSGVAFVAVYSNKGESLAALKQHAREKESGLVCLHDESQQLAKRYGALRTPEVFVLNSDRKIEYMGAIDGTYTGRPNDDYLRVAISQIMEQEEVTKPTTRATGCAIRWK